LAPRWKKSRALPQKDSGEINRLNHRAPPVCRRDHPIRLRLRAVNDDEHGQNGRPHGAASNGDQNVNRVLRDSEDRFRLLVEGLLDYGIFMLDLAGHIASWNVGAERMKGYRAEEIVGKHFSIFYSPEEIVAGKCEMELKLAAEAGRYAEEGWRYRKDGSKFWADVVITKITDPAGRHPASAR
jgi:PAS domain S-box-containing protein